MAKAFYKNNLPKWIVVIINNKINRINFNSKTAQIYKNLLNSEQQFRLLYFHLPINEDLIYLTYSFPDNITAQLFHVRLVTTTHTPNTVLLSIRNSQSISDL